MIFQTRAAATLLVAIFVAGPASAAPATAQLVIREHRFVPADLVLPADTKVAISIHNDDTTSEEFESTDLNREKLVGPGSDIVVFVGPLSAGTYTFFGDFHPDAAKGRIVVK